MTPWMLSHCLSTIQAICAPDSRQINERQLSGRLFAGWNDRIVSGTRPACATNN
jgi:hypothetical protein